MRVKESPQAVPERSADSKEPALPAPEGRPGTQWEERAEKAKEARALGQRLRRGKRVLFSSRHHLPR